MQWRWAAAWLLALAGPAHGALVARGAAASAGSRTGAPPADVHYWVMPGVPSVAQSSLKVENSNIARSWASSEARAAQEQAQTALMAEEAEMAQANVAASEFKAADAARMAEVAADRTKIIEKEAVTVAQDTQALIDGLPAKLDAAVRRAVNDAVARAISTMNADVARTVNIAKAEQAMGAAKAAKGAVEAARPFQIAKIRTAQTMQQYLNTADELAAAVKELKLKAIELATVAGPLQAAGNVVMAQRLNMQARDLMDKAMQMSDQAKGFNAKANEIRTQIGSYDVAASTAAAYGAYRANPAGDSLEIPRPPMPLVLPAGVNGPAPAAALAPAPAPSPGLAAAPAPR